MRTVFVISLVFLSSITIAQPHESKVQSGPMLGYSEMRECLVWLQLNTEGHVRLKYWVDGAPDSSLTEVEKATGENAYVVKPIARNLEPGMQYNYQVLIDGKVEHINAPMSFSTQPLWQWRTDPPPFKFALGSCSYINDPAYDRPGKSYGGDYRVFHSIVQQEPDMMLWLGDNAYLREADWYTRSGILHRYSHTRSIHEMQLLLATANNYATWDDHDFGPNDADGSFAHKDKTLEAFKLFWANNGYGVNGEPGITGFFKYHDIDFFLLDNRYNRTPQYNVGKREILGTEQIEWLIAALKNSKAPFKMIAVGGQFLNPAKVYENHSNYPEERKYIIQRLKEEKINNVIFLTGDRHHTELSKYEEDGFVIYDLTVSPLTSSASTVAENETNELRIEGTLVEERNFATIEVSGKRTERSLDIRVFNSKGGLLWKHRIE